MSEIHKIIHCEDEYMQNMECRVRREKRWKIERKRKRKGEACFCSGVREEMF